MTVDLSKAKPGMIAKFRCGGQAVIDKIKLADDDAYWLIFKDDFDDIYYYYTKNGCRVFDGRRIIDIIALEEPPFDWKDVKPGMAFKWIGDSRVCEFVGKTSSGFYVFTRPWDHTMPYSGWKSPEQEFTRAPEHDKVKEAP